MASVHARPVSLVERFQLTMENLENIGSIFHVGACLHLDPGTSHDHLLAHFHDKVQLMLTQIPILRARFASAVPTTTATTGKKTKQEELCIVTSTGNEPSMIVALAEKIFAPDLITYPSSALSTRGSAWDEILPLVQARAKRIISMTAGPLWTVSLFRPATTHSSPSSASSVSSNTTFTTSSEDKVYLVLSISHALADGRAASNILNTLLSLDPVLDLSTIDTAPLYPTFEHSGLNKLNLAGFIELIRTAILALLPIFVKYWLNLPTSWPNNMQAVASRTAATTQLQADSQVRSKTVVLDADTVLGLKAAATQSAPGKCTLHAAINEALKVATIVAHRAEEQTHRSLSPSSPALPSQLPVNVAPIPPRLPFRFASQTPIDMRAEANKALQSRIQPSKAGVVASPEGYGRFAGNVFGMQAFHLSNATDVPFWTEAAAFARLLADPTTRYNAAAMLGVLALVPRAAAPAIASSEDDNSKSQGDVRRRKQKNQQGNPVSDVPAGQKMQSEGGTGLHTGWEGFFSAAFNRRSDLAGTCNFSNLGLVSQPYRSTQPPSAPQLPATKLMHDLDQQQDVHVFESPLAAVASGASTPTTLVGGDSPKFPDILTTSMTPIREEGNAATTLPSSRAQPEQDALLLPSQIDLRSSASEASSLGTRSGGPVVSKASGPGSDGDWVVRTNQSVTEARRPSYQLDEVLLHQTAQPGSCAFFIDVAGCATATADPSAPHATAARRCGGTITLSVTWFEGSLPAVCTHTFVRALEVTLEILAQSGQEVRRLAATAADGGHQSEEESTKSAGRRFVVDGSTTIAEVVRQVERRLVEV
ncbi:hypothetical protein V8E36_007682 [Tilletia maclaganii]